MSTTQHTWVREEVGGGYVGSDEFWTCSVCGAAGGPTYNRSGPRPDNAAYRPFVAGTGIMLGDDCAKAKRLTDAYKVAFKVKSLDDIHNYRMCSEEFKTAMDSLSALIDEIKADEPPPPPHSQCCR